MTLFRPIPRRRKLISSAALTAAALPERAQAAEPAPKKPGETKVVVILGTDYWHNGIAYEQALREVFAAKKDWRIQYVRANRFFTPALIADADLLIACRTSAADPIDFFAPGQGVAEELVSGVPLWTAENVRAIIANVRDRGMGFLALHNTIYCGNRDILDFLDVREIMHREIQPVWAHNFDQGHPVTKGVGKFYIALDEQFGVVIKSPETRTLFETTAIHDKRQAVGGWCLERGKGRIVGLLPGHEVFPYRAPEYQTILWRSAHWAMRRDISPYPGENNTLYQDPMKG